MAEPIRRCRPCARIAPPYASDTMPSSVNGAPTELTREAPIAFLTLSDIPADRSMIVHPAASRFADAGTVRVVDLMRWHIAKFVVAQMQRTSRRGRRS